MKKMTAVLTTLLTTAALFVGISSILSPASAVTCGTKNFYSSTTAWVAGDDLKVAGRPLKWDFSLNKQECSDGDHISNVKAHLKKDHDGCLAASGTTRAYKFNPNSLGGVNAGTKEVPCNTDFTEYTVNFSEYAGVVLTSRMSDDERCLNFTFVVNIVLIADSGPYTNAAPICFNGS